MWAARVAAALDAAASLTAAATALAAYDGKTAVEMLTRAEALRTTGRADGLPSTMPTREESIAEWERMNNGSWSDPEFRKKIYKAAADDRRLALDEAEKAATARSKALAGAAKLRRRRRT